VVLRYSVVVEVTTCRSSRRPVVRYRYVSSDDETSNAVMDGLGMNGEKD
jgi:hypothetical protein